MAGYRRGEVVGARQKCSRQASGFCVRSGQMTAVPCHNGNEPPFPPAKRQETLKARITATTDDSYTHVTHATVLLAWFRHNK